MLRKNKDATNLPAEECPGQLREPTEEVIQGGAGDIRGEQGVLQFTRGVALPGPPPRTPPPLHRPPNENIPRL